MARYVRIHKSPWAIVLTATIIIAVVLLLSSGCARKAQPLSEAEIGVFAQIAGVAPDGFADITAEALPKDRADRFPAVTAVARTEGGLYGFITRPVAYNGPIVLALVIDSTDGRTVGMRIVEHEETEHYVRDMTNSWFIDRFANKSASRYLELARLEARNDYDIVTITGATITTEGIINGVNAAFGVYQEFVLQGTAQSVPYMVRFTPGDGDGPVETGSIAIRAYGVVLGEVSLEDIRELPSVRRTMSISSTVGVTQHNFRGALLSDVMDLLDPTLKERYGWLRTIGVDGFLSDINMEEVRKENSVFLMYEDHGEPLPQRNGEPGSMRVIVMDDLFGQRFTNFLLELVLEDEVGS